MDTWVKKSLRNTAEGPSAAPKIPNSNKNVSIYFGGSSTETLIFKQITSEEMPNSILKLVDKSCDISNIPNKITNIALNQLCIPLAHLFNIFIYSGVFLVCLRKARRFRIFK